MADTVSSWPDLARKQLRAAGYRLGSARGAVIEYLGQKACCVSMQEIYEDLRAAGESTGLASVYRIVETLAEQNLVQRVDIGDGVARFEPVGATRGHHHHLVCNDCGRVDSFSDQALERAIHRVEQQSAFAVDTHDVVLRGSCASCR